jgi:3-deoxy-D-manno-octulosonic-acid transferase
MKKARAGLAQKLGFIPSHLASKREKLKGAVWLHAVSVGEFNAVFPLLLKLRQERPDLRFVVSTTTGTGQKLAQEKLAALGLSAFYFPFDLPFAVNSWLNFLQPAAIIIAETEIWPGFVYQVHRRGIPLLVVNGRMSPKSFRSYRRFKFLFGRVLSQFSAIGVLSEAEKERYQAVAGPSLKVSVLGNLKFDGLKPVSKAREAELRQKLGLSEKSFVIVAGSTHEGEELALLRAFAALKKEHGRSSDLHLILVPRHPERFEVVAQLIKQEGFGLARYSLNESLADSGAASGAVTLGPVYLLDTIGQLFDFYSLASIAFVGGTLAPIGGHNIMEPYAYASPVVIGPRYEKTRDSAKLLIEREAILVCADAFQLSQALAKLYKAKEERQAIGRAGETILLESQGTVAKACDFLRPYLPAKVAEVSKR